MKSEYNRQGLVRFWLTRLQVEFRAICFSHGVQLQPPVFEIVAGKNQLGCWQSSTRSLQISAHLIESYPWAITMQVLRHEMAHQYCSEVVFEDRYAHGAAFQKACNLLGVLPNFRRARVITNEVLQGIDKVEGQKSKTCKILTKIQKLLALGQSSNSHEAEAALQKASLLIDKYQIDQLKAGEDENYTVTVIETRKKQVATYRRHICRIIQEFFYVRVVLSETYVPMTNGVQKTVELLGTHENTAIAEYCFHYLENQLEVLWKKFQNVTGKKGRTQKNSYYLGVVLGFYQKLKAQSAASTSVNRQRKELLVIEDHRLMGFVQMYYPCLHRSSSRKSRVDSDSYQHGMAEGQNLTLNDGVTGKSATAPLKLLK